MTVAAALLRVKPARLDARTRNSRLFCQNEEFLGNRHQERSAVSTGARRMCVRARVIWLSVCLATAALAVPSSTLQAQGQSQGQAEGQGRRTLEGIAEVIYEDSPGGGRLLHFLNTENERIPLKAGPTHRNLKN